jgi:hypothetical protein
VQTSSATNHQLFAEQRIVRDFNDSAHQSYLSSKVIEPEIRPALSESVLCVYFIGRQRNRQSKANNDFESKLDGSAVACLNVLALRQSPGGLRGSRGIQRPCRDDPQTTQSTF